MTISKLASTLLLASLSGLLVACGDSAPAKTPEAPTPDVAPPTTAAPVASAAPVVDAGPPPMKGSFGAFTRAATSGKVDKVGEKDGAYKADGVKDLVFDVEFEGAAAAFFIASVDDSGAPTGDFDADTLTGSQQFPAELSRALNAGGYSAGVVVFEGDKMLNDKDGGLVPALAEGKHKLTLHVSAKAAPKGPVKVYAMLTDKTVVAGPVVAGVAAAGGDKKPTAGGPAPKK